MDGALIDLTNTWKPYFCSSLLFSVKSNKNPDISSRVEDDMDTDGCLSLCTRRCTSQPVVVVIVVVVVVVFVVFFFVLFCLVSLLLFSPLSLNVPHSRTCLVRWELIVAGYGQCRCSLMSLMPFLLSSSFFFLLSSSFFFLLSSFFFFFLFLIFLILILILISFYCALFKCHSWRTSFIRAPLHTM